MIQNLECTHTCFLLFAFKWMGVGGWKTTHLSVCNLETYPPSGYLIVMSHSVLDGSVSWITPLHNGPSSQPILKKNRRANLHRLQRHTCMDTDHAVHPRPFWRALQHKCMPLCASTSTVCVSVFVCVWKSPLRLTHPSFLAHPSSEQTCSGALKTPRLCQFTALQAHFLPRSAW